MAIRETIVGFSQINGALSKNHESVMSKTRDEAENVSGDPLEATKMLAGLAGALKALEAAEKSPSLLSSPEHPVGSLLQTFIAQRASEEGKLEPLPMGLEAKFDDQDWLGWIGSFFTWWRKIVPHKFPNAAPQAESLPNDARLAVLGDWGTGLYGAPICAKSIEKDSDRYNMLLHLGDVYYSGNNNEVKERFLDFWPKVAGASNRALNSNHEMYTGGYAYFDMTLKQFGQPASYFAVQNDFWTLVGLDTAYHEHDLTDDQVAWLKSIVAAAGNRKVVLFSHHQPYSLLDNQGPKLTTKLADLLSARRIFAWYWGHEHRCVVYDPHPLWGLQGRCIGHGGYPYFRTAARDLPAVPGQKEVWHRLEAKNMVPGGMVIDGPNPYVQGEEDKYGPHGYASLHFDGGHLTEILRDADGVTLYEKKLA